MSAMGSASNVLCLCCWKLVSIEGQAARHCNHCGRHLNEILSTWHPVARAVSNVVLGGGTSGPLKVH